MPLNLHSIDYTKIPLQTNDYSGLTDLVKNFMEGYELSQKPQKLRSEAEKLKQEALQAAHKTTSMGNEAKYSEQSYRGKAGQEEMLAEILRKYGGAEKESEIEARLAQAFHNRQSGQNGSRGLTPGWRTINSMPAAAREAMLAQARAWGFSDPETLSHIGSGGTMEDLKNSAMNSGIDVENAVPINVPTTSNINQQKSMDAGLAELEVLENFTTEALGDRITTVFGYSPKQFVDSLRGLNEDEQAKYLAARAMQPEIAGARMKLSGGSNASEAMHDLVEKSFGESKVFRPLVSPEVFKKMQHYMNETLKQGNKARKSALHNIKRPKDNAMKTEAINNASGNVFGDYGNEDLYKMLEGVK